MNVPARSFHVGYYSETYASVIIGELILLAFEVLLLAIFKTKQLHHLETASSDPWAVDVNLKSQPSIKSTDGLQPAAENPTSFIPEIILPLPITNLSNLFLAHGIALAIAFVTPHHSIVMIILAWVHGAFYSATVLAVVHEKKIAFVFVLVCLLFDIAILALCLAEKVMQIDLYRVAEPIIFGN